MKAFRFKPILKTVIWGGSRIPTCRGLEPGTQKIGESWEISGLSGKESVVAEGEDAGLTLSELIAKYGASLVGQHIYRKYGTAFPILMKIIDANEDLSVQVHPNDELAKKLHQGNGKTEMWYVIDSKPGAKIYDGLSRDITQEEYYRLVKENDIMSVVATYEANAGDVFYVPAGCIHAIGAGNLLLEVQETSDTTYRVYDFDRRDKDGNKRELHTDLAAEAMDYKSRGSYRQSYDKSAIGVTPLINCGYFNVSRIMVDNTGTRKLPTVEDSFTIIFCVNGNVSVNGTDLSQWESILVSAEEQELQASGNGILLCITA